MRQAPPKMHPGKSHVVLGTDHVVVAVGYVVDFLVHSPPDRRVRRLDGEQS